MKKALTLLALVGVIPQAQASCGSMACEMNPAWDIESLTRDHGLRLDLRYTYSKADTLRAGADRIDPPPLTGSGEEIENRRTINQTLTVDLDYAINRAWSLSLQVPLLSRDHAHTIDDLPPELEQAKYTRLGDVRVIGKYRFMAADHVWGGGLRFGLKLNSGDTDQEMAPGEAMEASLQPDSGSTDLILCGPCTGRSPTRAEAGSPSCRYRPRYRTVPAMNPAAASLSTSAPITRSTNRSPACCRSTT